MSEIQVGQINSTDGSTAITTGADGYVSFAKTQIGGRRNMVINGAMQVWQRSTSTVTISDGSNEGYNSVDRFKMVFGGAAGGAVTWAKSTDAPDGFNNSLKVDCSTTTTTTGTQEISITHVIEGQDLQALAYGGTSPQTATLSFWFKTNKVGLYSVYLQTSGTGTRRRYFTFTPAASDTWERISIQISGDSVAIPDTNGYGLLMALYLANTPDYDDAATSTDWGTVVKLNSSSNVNFMDSTSNELYITGVQLEVGTVATPFEHRSYGEELALCMRYFEKSYANAIAPGTGGYDQGASLTWAAGTSNYYSFNDRFKFEKRATPTITTYNPGTGAVSQMRNTDTGSAIGVSSVSSPGTSSPFAFVYSASTASTDGQRYNVHWTADAEL